MQVIFYGQVIFLYEVIIIMPHVEQQSIHFLCKDFDLLSPEWHLSLFCVKLIFEISSFYIMLNSKKFSFAPIQVALMSNPSWQGDFFHHNYCFQTVEHILLKSSRFSNVDFHVKQWNCMYCVYANNQMYMYTVTVSRNEIE